ncbi:MAG: hypothetical protein JNL98_06780 [Bryobacterales bacterium]|nr:hypothetical protein [Bryobacterales bacterium]
MSWPALTAGQQCRDCVGPFTDGESAVLNNRRPWKLIETIPPDEDLAHHTTPDPNSLALAVLEIFASDEPDARSHCAR